MWSYLSLGVETVVTIVFILLDLCAGKIEPNYLFFICCTLAGVFAGTLGIVTITVTSSTISVTISSSYVNNL